MEGVHGDIRQDEKNPAQGDEEAARGGEAGRGRVRFFRGAEEKTSERATGAAHHDSQEENRVVSGTSRLALSGAVRECVDQGTVARGGCFATSSRHGTM